MKVLLVRPDLVGTKYSLQRIGLKHQPLGLLYLAASLLEDGHEVIIADELIGDLATDFIIKHKPDYVGVTSATPLIERAGTILKFAKKQGCVTMVGGPHCTSLPIHAMEVTGADICAMGEAEFTIKEIVAGKPFKDIKGIMYRDENGLLKVTESRPRLESLDLFPHPARRLLDINRYLNDFELGFHFEKDQICGRIYTSRGCKYQCSFCARHVTFGRSIRLRSVESMMDEIIDIQRLWGTRYICFMDDTFTYDEQRVVDLCKLMIKNKLHIRWSCFARVGLEESTLRIMYQSGCHLIGYGVESGSQKILDFLKKEITLDEIYNTFELTKQIGIRTKAYFMIGLPGEGDEEYEESVHFIQKLTPDFIVLSIFIPLPGSDLYWNLTDEDMEKYNKHAFFHADNPRQQRLQIEFFLRTHLRPAFFKTFFTKYTRFEVEEAFRHLLTLG
ncbi:MAG: radical SAM protein [Candidatus Coatesbacteria bacterium]|nr:radical SAM protein [Candidatus Coatesbacteria bacterium]